MATKFNDEQLQAIESKSKEILVAAGAGSGKSTVLIERLMRKIIQDKMNVDQFLIVTFTNLAAREMAEKLRESLNGALAENPNSTHLQQQLYKIPYANISTFHGFCNKVLQRYYYLVDLDVNMQLMDDMEAVMMRAEILDEFMNIMYEDADFRLLVHVFGSDRSDAALGDLLMKIYEIARANPEMESWLSGLCGLYQISGNTVDNWEFYEQMKDLIFPLLEASANHVEKARGIAEMAGTQTVPHGYLEKADDDLALINRVSETLELGSYEEVRNLLTHTKIPNFPARSSKLAKENWDEALHKEASGERKKFKDILDALNKDFFAYTNESHLLHFSGGQKLVATLAPMVMRFHERFSAEKRALSKLDFSDLERLTLKILLENAEVLHEIAADFKEIMIDEYQDTNEMQERIVKLITEAGNIPMFMVGDVKQSIYRFRLADPSIFQKKYAAYTRYGTSKSNEHVGEKIDLMQNYRSSRDVIDATNYLFAPIMDIKVGEIEYDEEAALKLGIEEKNHTFNKPELHIIDKGSVVGDDIEKSLLHDAGLEAHFIAKKIRTMIDTPSEIWDRKAQISRRIQYNDIVILLRSMSASSDFYEILSSYNIPVSTVTPGNLLEETEIITILSVLRTIDNPYQDIPLVAIMRSPLFFFTEPELARIRIQADASSLEPELAEIRIKSPADAFYESVKAFGSTAKKSDLQLKVAAFLAKLTNWRHLSKNSSIASLLRTIYEETSYYEFVLGITGGELRRANLDLLETVAVDYETRTTKGVYGFLHYLDHLQALGKEIPKAKVPSDSEGVKIMTIHKSKGLEFPIVFVASIQKQFNTQDEIGDYVIHKNFGIGVQYIDPVLRLKQKTLTTTLLAKKIHNEMLAEEMRLLYVALTRSKSKLILTAVMKDTDTINKLAETNIAPTHVRLASKRYIDWILPVVSEKTANNPWQWEIITEIDILAFVTEKTIPEKLTPPKINFDDIFAQTYPLEELTTITAKQSVTQRKIEETVPLYKGIPEPVETVAYDQPSFIQTTTKATEVGTAFHQFMQHLPIQAGHTLESLISLKDDLVARNIIKSQLAAKVNLEDIYHFTKSAIYGELLTAEKIHKELPFTMLFDAGLVEEAKALLQGVIDLLAEFEHEVWILDYKTDKVGNFASDEPMLKRRYDIQMKYYLQAIRDIYPNKTAIAKVYFMRAGRLITYR